MEPPCFAGQSADLVFVDTAFVSYIECRRSRIRQIDGVFGQFALGVEKLCSIFSIIAFRLNKSDESARFALDERFAHLICD